MTPTFFSLLGSLAQANFVWNGDIVLSVAMSGGGVDWLGLLGLAIIIGVVWVIASRKR
jgi:predicted phage tail protein